MLFLSLLLLSLLFVAIVDLVPAAVDTVVYTVHFDLGGI